MIRIHLRNPKFALKTGKRKKKEPTEEGSVTTTSPLKEHARHAFLRFGPICIMGLIEPNTRNKALVTSTSPAAAVCICRRLSLPARPVALAAPLPSVCVCRVCTLLLSYLSTCTCCCPWCGVPLSADPTCYVTGAHGQWGDNFGSRCPGSGVSKPPRRPRLPCLHRQLPAASCHTGAISLGA
jgi:hypothetical protein